MELFEKLKSLIGVPTKAEIAKAEREAEIAAFAVLEPEVVISISGFNVKAEKNDGVLLTAKGNEKVPASEDTYYEVEVIPTGENEEYPECDKSYKALFTTALNEGSGFIGGVSFAPEGYKPFKFELSEDFFDAKKPYMGHATASHHSLTLTAHFKNVDGETTKQSMGFAIRKSDQPAVDAMRGSKTFYI